ncbi:uncharacterized protein LOC107689943 [Tachysurus ichikawai]
MAKSTCAEIKALKEKMGGMERSIEKSEQSTLTCLNRVSDLERYGRRWNLKLYGIPEAAGENVLNEVICICQEVLPQEREKLRDVIDVAHRLGTKRPNESRPQAAREEGKSAYFVGSRAFVEGSEIT